MTLIGNRSGLAFELLPVTPDWESPYGPERTAWAGLTIWVGNENLCRHIRPGSSEVEDRLYVPLAPIADWLVRSLPALTFEERASRFPTTRRLHLDVDRWGEAPPPSGMEEEAWLDEREQWWSRHFLSAGADGAQLPNLALVRDDEELAMTWAAPRFVGVDAPSLFSQAGEFSVPWTDGRAVLTQFVSRVSEWLLAGEAADVFDWAVEADPLASVQTALHEAIELFTGRRLSDLESLFRVNGYPALLRHLQLTEIADDPAASVQCQILRDLSPSLNREVATLLDELGEETAHEDPELSRRWRRVRATAQDAARSASSIFAAGQAAAIQIRRQLVTDGGPVGDIAPTLLQLGLRYQHRDVAGEHERMIAGGGRNKPFHALTLRTMRTEHEWGQRFEAARALGHVLLDPLRAETIGAASGPFAQATRRMRSGAFAAEFLLPESAISELSQGSLDGAARPDVFRQIMESYGIGARATAFQMWNRGWLSSPVIRDELIDRFASMG